MSFTQELKKLNPKQLEAVQNIEGPVMVIAGPGTGKTQILTLRIANILDKTDTEPENVLAITFTESGVSAMRKRLSELIGSVAYSVNISTFHSFANQIIQEYPEEFPRIIGSQSIDEVEQIEILEEVIKNSKFKFLKPFGDPLFYLKSSLSAINELKREGIEVRDFKGAIKEQEEDFSLVKDLKHKSGRYKGRVKTKYQDLKKQIQKNKELSILYSFYEKKLKDNGKYDYSDMIMEVVKALKENKDFLYILQEKYQYLLVDEHQDTNNAQNKLLELLASFHKNPNLFVVGDQSQAIFRFQGASLENFLYFKKLYKNAKLIKLIDNYRSTQKILDASSALRSPLGLCRELKLKSQAKHKERQIEVAELESLDLEHYFIARHIRERINAGIFPYEIAVLYRDNKDAFGISKMLERLGVPFVIESDQDIFEDPDIRKILLLLEAIDDFGSKEKLIQLLHIDFLKVDSLNIYKFSKEKDPYLTLKTELPDLYKKLNFWNKKAKFENMADLFEAIIFESGFLTHILSLNNSLDKLAKINTLFAEIKRLVSNHRDFLLKNFLNYLDLLKSHNLPIKKGSLGAVVRRVRLMTAHKAKGQEFSYVYLINAFDGHWGQRRRVRHFKLPYRALSLLNLESSQEDEEERNLFYVALTRAKKEVVITYSKYGIDKKEHLPTKFIGEIDKNHISEIDTSGYEEDFSKQKEIVFSSTKKQRISIREKELIQELFLAQGFSATSLNNYLECPWKYFYLNLLRIPEAKNKHLMYGIAVHEALRKMFAQESRSRECLLLAFEKNLKTQPFQKGDYQEILKKGKESLSGYFNKYKNTWDKRFLNEFFVRTEFPDLVENQQLKLSGRLDRIDVLDEDKLFVKVVDYKTGKPKTRKYIQGQTKNSTGNYYRQLVFYGLLLRDGKYKMQSGEIDFVEPDSQGRYHKEEFIISKDQINQLEKQILQISKEILGLKFWKKRCSDKKCKYCKLREFIK